MFVRSPLFVQFKLKAMVASWVWSMETDGLGGPWWEQAGGEPAPQGQSHGVLARALVGHWSEQRLLSCSHCGSGKASCLQFTEVLIQGLEMRFGI